MATKRFTVYADRPNGTGYGKDYATRDEAICAAVFLTDSKTFEVVDDHPDQDEAINLAASEVIEKWRLSPGDTITIREV